MNGGNHCYACIAQGIHRSTGDTHAGIHGMHGPPLNGHLARGWSSPGQIVITVN